MNIYDNITNQLLKRHIIEEDESSIYKLGLRLIFSDIINIFSVIVTGFLFNSLLCSFIYIVIFCGIRKFSGGFHASNFRVCRMSMIGVFIATLILARVTTKIAIWISVFCTIFTIITMILFSPIVHPNRELTEYEIRANKLMSILLSCIVSVVVYWLLMIKANIGSYLALTLFAVAILMYVGKFTNSKNRELQRFQ